MIDAVHAGLLVVAAVLCALWVVPSVLLRRALRTALIVTTALAAYLTGGSWAEALLILALLTIIGLSLGRYSNDLRRSEQAEGQARRDAERRAQLLEAVRNLPELDLPSAARATAAALRSFGANGSGVAMIHDDRLVPVELDNLPPVERLLRVGEGVVGTAAARGETFWLEDYQQLEARLPDRDHVRTAYATPIRVEGDVVGVVFATKPQPGGPTSDELEVAEVLASHLGAVVATRRQLDNQRLLLARLGRLDAMRTAFAEEVSDELRDPLTFIRSAGHTMRAHGERLPADDRIRLLDRLADRSMDLRLVIDALLDFSRFQASDRQPEVRPLSLRELVAPLPSRFRVDPSAAMETEVTIDVGLVRQAIEVLVPEVAAAIEVEVHEASVAIVLRPRDPEGHPGLVRSLAAQLLAEAGASLAEDPVPVLILPRAARPPEVVA